MSTLFDEAFVRALAPLRIVARQVPAAGRPAEHRSRDRGAGLEFRDFRGYVPGDDLRRVDWNVYRRSGRLVMRLFEQPEDLAVHVLVDVSDSMFLEDPPRANAARQLAAAFAAVALNQLDRAGVYPFGADLGVPLPVTADKRALPRVLDFLERLGPAGPTDLARVLRRFGTLRARSGLAVVISDFFDPHGLDAVLPALAALRQRLVLVQVVRAADADPDVPGEFTLVDCETGGEVDVAATARVRARYQEAYARFQAALHEFAARRGAVLVRVDAEQPVLAQLGSLFRNGTLVI
jgi:uncharacterized protein (DUF58 family)